MISKNGENALDYIRSGALEDSGIVRKEPRFAANVLKNKHPKASVIDRSKTSHTQILPN
jgi:UPF0288 family protein (methanogenesis marker protein 3)